MKTSWTKTFRRLAAGCAVCGATMLSSAMNYAYGAFDSASDPVYAGAWDGITNADVSPFGPLTAGDNGGTGAATVFTRRGGGSDSQVLARPSAPSDPAVNFEE